jgi:hypothetical protein
MDIAQAREALNSRGKHRFAYQMHIDVDDRLGCQIGNGRAANVLNGRRDVTECISASFAKGLKESWPVGVVLQNDNGIRHGAMAESSIGCRPRMSADKSKEKSEGVHLKPPNSLTLPFAHPSHLT